MSSLFKGRHAGSLWGMRFSTSDALTLGLIRDAKGRWIQPPKLSEPLPEPQEPGVSRESILHDDVIRWLEQRGWKYVHSRMDAKTTVAIGLPDLIIAAPRGRTFWIELKTRKGKLRPEQRHWEFQLRQLGHIHAVVRCLSDFIRVVQSDDT